MLPCITLAALHPLAKTIEELQIKKSFYKTDCHNSSFVPISVAELVKLIILAFKIQHF
jgi:hypothetical protein